MMEFVLGEAWDDAGPGSGGDRGGIELEENLVGEMWELAFGVEGDEVVGEDRNEGDARFEDLGVELLAAGGWPRGGLTGEELAQRTVPGGDL